MNIIEKTIATVKRKLKRDGFDELPLELKLSFWRPIGDNRVKELGFLRERFEKTYPVIKKRIAQKSDSTCFDSCTAIIDGVEVSYFSEHYPNPEFDKEYCMRSCAERREINKVLEAHKDEIDIEGRIKRIKEKKEIGCQH